MKRNEAAAMAPSFFLTCQGDMTCQGDRYLACQGTVP